MAFICICDFGYLLVLLRMAPLAYLSNVGNPLETGAGAVS
jgi:hypothetical protein